MQEQPDATPDRPGFWAGFFLASLIGAGACVATYAIAHVGNPVPEHMRVAEYATIVIGHDPKLAEGESDPTIPSSGYHGSELGHGGNWGATVVNYASKERAERQIRRVQQLLMGGRDKSGGEAWYDRIESREFPPLKLAAKLPPHERCRVLHGQATNRWLDLVDAAKAAGIDQGDDPKCDDAGERSSIWRIAAEATDPKRGEWERRELLQDLVECIGWHAVLTNAIPLPAPKE